MATTSTSLIPMSTSSRPATQTAPRRRRMTPEAGKAIEILGHAIEYLADEFALESMVPRQPGAGGMHPAIAAIEILKSRNREIYLSCPELPSVSERLRSWLGLQRA